MARILAIIPCLNEQDTVLEVIEGIRQAPIECDILVVDDGSSDNTSSVAAASGAKVIRLPTNLGIGAAVHTGYRYAAKHGYEITVRMDGDGQHPPSEVEKVISPILQGQADFVVGSRYSAGTQADRRVSSLSRMIGGRVLSWCIKLLSGKTIKDPTSGFRAATAQVAHFLMKNYPVDYPEPLSIQRVLRSQFSVMEVPIHMVPRSSGVSSISPLQAVTYMVKVIWSLCLDRIYSQGSKNGCLSIDP